MKPIAFYTTLEDAEAAGEKLIAAGIEPQLDGDLANGANITIAVADDDAERAESVLGLKDEPPEPFHPCPVCGVGDPIWLAKWKLLFVLASGVLIVGLGMKHVPPIDVGYTALACVAVYVLLVLRLKDFECRQCHTRFSG